MDLPPLLALVLCNRSSNQRTTVPVRHSNQDRPMPKTNPLDQISEREVQKLREIEDRLRQVIQERKASLRHRAVTAEQQIGSITFRYETVRCGKPNCTRCPHGPYWYAYWKENGRTRSRYVGSSLPQRAKDVHERKQRAKLEKKTQD